MQLKDVFGQLLNAHFPGDADLPFPISKRFIRKGEVITDFGQVESSVYFLQVGLVELSIQSYTSLKTVDFFFTGEFFCSYSSFLTQTPSDVRVTALVDCETELFTYADLQTAYQSSFQANKLGRLLNERAYLKKARREKDFLSKTAEERYAEMFETHPDYLMQVPVNKIARYLGIHPESLSRIRKKLRS